MKPIHAPPLLGHLDPAASRQVEEVLRNTVSRVRTRLVYRVGTDLPLGPVTVDWAPLGQVLDRLSGMATARFQIEPSGLVGLVAIDTDLLTLLVGQILGQSPDRPWLGREGRSPSRFDMVIARRIAEDVLGGIVEVISPEVAQTVTVDTASAQRGMGLPRTALVGAAQYEIPLPAPEGAQGRILVVLPSEIARMATPKRITRQENRAGLERVMPLPVVAVAEVRRISMSLAQLREIRVGHMLDLGSAKDVVILVGDKPALVGEAGVQNQMRSVRIRGRAEGAMATAKR
jgi:flagellar motor switch protein FliM